MASEFLNKPQINIVTVGTQPRQWFAPPNAGIGTWTTYGSALSAVSAYLHGITIPASDAPTGLYVETQLDPANRIEFRFAGGRSAADPNNLTATGRLWLLSEITLVDDVYEYIGEYCGDLTLTVGNSALATGSKLLNPSGHTCKWVDTIAFAPDRTYGGAVVVGSQADDGAAAISIDLRGHRGYALQIAVGASLTSALPLRRLV